MSYYNFILQFDATLSDNICGQKFWSFLTIEFGQKRSFCTLLAKVFSPKIGGQKYTFCTLLTTTVLTFSQNYSFPIYFKSKCHIII